jgi:hypothetical protein
MSTKKILITGTGRSGTTFLIKLFTFLEYDTGYTKDNFHNYIDKGCKMKNPWKKILQNAKGGQALNEMHQSKGINRKVKKFTINEEDINIDDYSNNEGFEKDVINSLYFLTIKYFGIHELFNINSDYTSIYEDEFINFVKNFVF